MNETVLLDELACARLLLRTGAFSDRHDVDGFLSLFAEDGVIDRIGQPFVGHNAIRALMEARPRDRVTRHLLSPPVIEVIGPNDATGRSYFSLYDGIGEPDGAVLPLKAPVLVGEFDQIYCRNLGEWKIARHKVSAVFRPTEGIRA
jgi:hypothetical protein